MRMEEEADVTSSESFWQRLSKTVFWQHKHYVVIGLTPLLLSPIAIAFPDNKGYTAYMIALMAVFWMSEVIPIAVTSLLPLAFFPLFGIMSAADVSVQYARDTNVLLLSSLMVAIVFEEWNVHKRVALRVLMAVGSKPRWLMLGFMLTTAFFSMWMINTATTAMMIPIAQAVLLQLDVKQEGKSKKEDGENQNFSDLTDENLKSNIKQEFDPEQGLPMENMTNETIVYQEKKDPVLPTNGYSKLVETKSDSSNYRNLCKAFMLCVPYAANIGGTATLIGTTPQQIALGQAERLYGGDTGLNFATYMMYAFPVALICLFLSWAWLQWYFFPQDRCCKKNQSQGDVTEQERNVTRYIRTAYNELGPWSFAEIAVLCHAVLMVLMWFWRDPKFVPGWSALFKDGYVKDSTVSICVALCLFVFPSKPPTSVFSFRKQDKSTNPVQPLLLWETLQRKFPWGVFFLLGGGFSLAEACKNTGLSELLAEKFSVLENLPPGAIALIVTIAIAAGTEVTSNTATASIFIPILGQMSAGLGVNPLFLMLPAAIACTYAFMLPVATPPNAIAFFYGHLKVIDMAKAGLILNITCVLVCNLGLHTLGVWIFDIKTYPDWARDRVTTFAPILENTTLCYVTAPC